MTEQHLTARELAERWRMSTGTLGNWRNQGIGPRYIKTGGSRSPVLYPLSEVEAWEAKRTFQNTQQEREVRGK